MTDAQLSRHPSPKRGRIRGRHLAFAVWGGPLAWFAQLNLNYALVATPCFSGPHRNLELAAETRWTFVATIIVYLLLLGVAVAAGLTAQNLYRRVSDETAGSNTDVEEAGTGRTRFLTYWGMLLGFGFAIVILGSAAALIMVPQCAL